MSHSLISSGDAGRPKSYAHAGNTNAPTIVTANMALLSKNIGHLPAGADAPGLLRGVMKPRIFPPLLDERFQIRLSIAPLVYRAADDFGGLAVPVPIHLKARLRLPQRGLVQLRFPPGLASVGTNFDFRDLAVA